MPGTGGRRRSPWVGLGCPRFRTCRPWPGSCKLTKNRPFARPLPLPWANWGHYPLGALFLHSSPPWRRTGKSLSAGPRPFPAAGPLLTVAESAEQPAALRKAALVTVEQVWPTGPKAAPLWDRLNRLAAQETAGEVKRQAEEAVKKIAPRRHD